MTSDIFDDTCLDPEPVCDRCGLPPSDCGCEECPTCHGTGRIDPLTAPKGHFVAVATDCPHCDGTGRFEG